MGESKIRRVKVTKRLLALSGLTTTVKGEISVPAQSDDDALHMAKTVLDLGSFDQVVWGTKAKGLEQNGWTPVPESYMVVGIVPEAEDPATAELKERLAKERTSNLRTGVGAPPGQQPFYKILPAILLPSVFQPLPQVPLAEYRAHKDPLAAEWPYVVPSNYGPDLSFVGRLVAVASDIQGTPNTWNRGMALFRVANGPYVCWKTYECPDGVKHASAVAKTSEEIWAFFGNDPLAKGLCVSAGIPHVRPIRPDQPVATEEEEAQWAAEADETVAEALAVPLPMRCNNCGHVSLDADTFVPSDGTPVAFMCPECRSVDVFVVDPAPEKETP